MDRNPDQKRAVQFLYPPIDPYDQRMLDVGDSHRIYVEQCGNPEGLPVIVLHGGPGGGCSPAMRRYFDPVFTASSCLISGGGRSRPHASVTQHHMASGADIERLRTLDIEDWIVF